MAVSYTITPTHEHSTSGNGGVPTSSTLGFTVEAVGGAGNYKDAAQAFHQYALANYGADPWGNPIAPNGIELVEEENSIGRLWRGTVRHEFPTATQYAGGEAYAATDPTGGGSTSQQDGINWYPFISSFTVAGGTKHVVQSYGTRSFAVNGSVVDFGGGIGWDGEAFEGVDVPCPAINFDVTARTPAGFLIKFASFLNKVLPYVGTVNSAKFYGCDPGTVLFNGITSGQLKTGTGSDGQTFPYWEMNFSFSAMPNVAVNVGGQSVFKSGWEYMWHLVDANGSIQATYIETVFQSTDFRGLGLGGDF